MWRYRYISNSLKLQSCNPVLTSAFKRYHNSTKPNLKVYNTTTLYHWFIMRNAFPWSVYTIHSLPSLILSHITCISHHHCRSRDQLSQREKHHLLKQITQPITAPSISGAKAIATQLYNKNTNKRSQCLARHATNLHSPDDRDTHSPWWGLSRLIRAGKGTTHSHLCLSHIEDPWSRWRYSYTWIRWCHPCTLPHSYKGPTRMQWVSTHSVTMVAWEWVVILSTGRQQEEKGDGSENEKLLKLW